MKFQEIVYELRKKAGYSQDELAVRCGVSRQSVSKWESGNAYPEIEKIMQLADIFDVSVDYLLGRSEKEKKVVMVEVPSDHAYEYKSKWRIFNLPLVHISLHSSWRFPFVGRRLDSKNGPCAKGVLAIGNTAIGIVSIGLRSTGLFSFGFLSFGLVFSIGILSLGTLSLGIIALGYLSFGIISIGIYAMGVIAIAAQIGLGVIVVAPTAIGVIPTGSIEFRDTKVNGQECMIAQKGASSFTYWLQQADMPTFVRVLLSYFQDC